MENLLHPNPGPVIRLATEKDARDVKANEGYERVFYRKQLASR